MTTKFVETKGLLENIEYVCTYKYIVLLFVGIYKESCIEKIFIKCS